MLCKSVSKETALIVVISGEFLAERLSSVYSAETKSWPATYLKTITNCKQL